MRVCAPVSVDDDVREGQSIRDDGAELDVLDHPSAICPEVGIC